MQVLEISDVAYTFYKILENASKILHPLQNDCSMEVRKFFDALHETIYAFSMQHTKLSGKCFRKNIQQTIFFESQETFWWF